MPQLAHGRAEQGQREATVSTRCMLVKPLTRRSAGSTVAYMKRRKGKAERKEESIRLRLTTEHKDVFTQAAEKSGLDLSNWIRLVLVREANRSLSEKS